MLSFRKLGSGVGFRLKSVTCTYNPDLLAGYINKLRNNDVIDLLENRPSCSSDQNVLETTRDHPLIPFGECVAEFCILRRKDNPIFRSFTENKIAEYIRENSNQNICITSYFSTGFFAELMIMSKISSRSISLNIINPVPELLEVIQDIAHNPHAVHNGIHYTGSKLEYIDDELERAKWVEVQITRIIKFLEVMYYLQIDLELNIFPHCQSLEDAIHEKLIHPSDIFYGLDYIDESPQFIFTFMECALKTTKSDGVIISLRTDGIFDSPNIHFTISKNQYNTSDEARLHALKTDIQTQRMFVNAEIHRIKATSNDDNDYEPVYITHNGKRFKYTSHVWNNEGEFDEYTTEVYNNAKAILEHKYDNFYDTVSEIFHQNTIIASWHGPNYCDIRMRLDPYINYIFPGLGLLSLSLPLLMH